MSPCFGDARKTWEVFGRCRKRRVTWRSWTEVKVYDGRGERGGQLLKAGVTDICDDVKRHKTKTRVRKQEECEKEEKVMN